MRVRLPETTEEFMALTKCFFGCRIYDVKCVMKSCDGLYGGTGAGGGEVGRAACGI
ncbi:putative CCR4-associated factor 1 like 11 [Dendrobium catenatum]|uniref:Putative CCR4-associated factor 1 like 11 n=1 Tax=Dendrobium catenatum TaxID=906689 RepID=A0A2I0XDF6_9ASPA|nr:putative CCR4-associated factor 1 like 11 [Dendrobium catenatum]